MLTAVSHAVVIRAAAALGRDPGDDLVGVHDVAGLAVHAVGRVQMDAFAPGRVGACGFLHLIDVGRAEILAGIAELGHATGVADVGIGDDQVRRLVFLVFGAGVVKIGQLVKGLLAVAFGLAQ